MSQCRQKRGGRGHEYVMIKMHKDSNMYDYGDDLVSAATEKVEKKDKKAMSWNKTRKLAMFAAALWWLVASCRRGGCKRMRAIVSSGQIVKSTTRPAIWSLEN